MRKQTKLACAKYHGSTGQIEDTRACNYLCFTYCNHIFERDKYRNIYYMFAVRCLRVN